MEAYFASGVLGFGSGAVYAALALGLVMTYKSSGVINFAHGAIAMYVAYTFYELRTAGQLLNPIFGLPPLVTITSGPAPLPVDFAISLAVAAIFGALAYGLIFRPLRDAPPLAKVVASVGLMITTELVVALRVGGGTVASAAVLPDQPVHVLGVQLPRDRFFLLAVIIALTAGLGALYKGTRFGLATRAAALNEKGALLTGLSPQRLALANWVLATLIAGLAGILIAPTTPINPATYTLFIVPALAAAFVGGFSAFWPTALAGMLLGVVQSLAIRAVVLHSWIPSGIAAAFPFLVIVVLMTIRGRPLPERGALIRSHFPVAYAPRRGWSAYWWTPLALVGLIVLPSTYRIGLVTSFSGAILCLSLVVVSGYLGQISLFQMTFAGVAGFLLSRFQESLGVPFPIAPIVSVVLTITLGLLVGLPALRVRGVNLAIITVGGAVAVEDIWFQNPSYTGGVGGSSVTGPKLGGLNLAIGGGGGAYPRPVFGILSLIVCVGAVAVVRQLRSSATGLQMLAVRSNERAAAAAGVNVARVKVFGFAVSAGLAGLAGTLIAYQARQVSFESYDVLISLGLFATAYLGGISTIGGALVGGALLTNGIVSVFVDRVLHLGQYETLLVAVFLIVAAILQPEGLVGEVIRLATRARRLVPLRGGARGGGPLAPSESGPWNAARPDEAAAPTPGRG